MRTIGIIFVVVFFLLVLGESGCEPMPETIESQGKVADGLDVSVYGDYFPAKVDILPLTEFVGDPEEDETTIRVYVSLIDSFGCQIKGPGTFRFELYERVVRSPEPKGKRLSIWTDFDLTDSATNNNYWRDFLRAYEFELDFENEDKRSFILEVTYIDPGGRRLTADFALK
ncbi:MAG: hypothetical protein ACYS0I_05085 [Planctomycetota bacterium]|jgi:hypothetical protein